MLILSNGPYKSGSTWLYNLIQQVTKPKVPPEEKCEPKWKHPSLLYAEIKAFAESADARNAVFLSKHHFRPQQVCDLAECAPDNLLFVSIERNLSDALVSAWHHHQNKHRIELRFSTFYWKYGRAIALGIIGHNRAMRELRADQVYIVRYERLLEEPHREIESLINFLGELAVMRDLVAILEATSIDKLRSKYDETSVVNGKSFFRSGTAGEGASHVTGAIATDLNRLETRGRDYFIGRVRARLSMGGRLF